MINNNFNETTLVSGSPTISCATKADLDNNKDIGPIVIETSYINYLNYDVSVVMRNGLRHTIKMVPHQINKTFIIRDKYHIRGESFDEIKKLFSVLGDVDVQYVKALEKSFYESGQMNLYGRVTLAIDTVIDAKTMAKSKGSIYLTCKDIVVSKSTLMDAVSHPFSGHTVVMDKYKSLLDNSSGASFYIEIIDNAAEFENRFFYIAKSLFEIKPRLDNSRESGIYFCSITVGDDGKPLVTKTKYNITEAEEKLGLYKTKEAALACGDIEASRKETIQRLSHEISINNIKLTELQHQYRLENDKLKQDHAALENFYKLDLLKATKTISDLERTTNERELSYRNEKILLEQQLVVAKGDYEHRKLQSSDYYEHRSYARKDSSEIIKIIPTFILGAVAIWAMVK